MQDFNTKAKELIQDIINYPLSKATDKVSEALNEAYHLGKKHLIEPHLLMGGEYQPIIEKDTYNPQA